MKKLLPFLAAVTSSLVLAACAANEKDIKEARNYRMGLAAHLGISPDQIAVEPTHGVTHVTFTGIQTQAQRQQIETDLTTLNHNNPKLNPLQWTFK